MLRQAIAATLRDQATIVICEGTAASPWVHHATKLFDCPALTLSVSPAKASFDRWLKRLQHDPPADRISISPPSATLDERPDIPRRDALAVEIADRVFALHVARDGNIDRLLQQRLAACDWHPTSVRIAITPDYRAAERRIAQGAVGWMIAPCPMPSVTDISEPATVNHDSLDAILARTAPRCDEGPWPFLVHCTRERDGTWPGQCEADYRDELLTGCCGRIQGTLASLQRILLMQRLIGTDRLTRGGQPVVCFSARPLADLLDRRVFRSHLGRWDYEPYGIAIRRDVLAAQGARAVVYGDDADFANLSPDQRTYFQSCGSTHDWTMEKEWRIAGDVDLAQIAAEEAFVFVPTASEAEQIAADSRWPIAVVAV